MSAAESPSHAARVATGLALGCLLVGAWAPLSILSTDEQRALGVTLFALLAWTFRPVPVELSSFAVLLLFPGLGLLDFRGAFAPFAGPTVWLVFAGMVLSLLLSETGLGQSLADRARPWLAGGGRLRLIVGLHLLGLAAAFLVPSGVVRVLLLLPMGLALCRALDPEGRDPVLAPAVTLSIVCGTYYGGCAVLTGSVPNLVVAGQLEAETGRVIYWGEWLLWMFPVTGVLRTLLSIGVIWWLWGRRLQPLPAAGADASPAPFDAPRRRALQLLLIGVALWASDVLHGLAPVTIGLVLVAAALVPRVGCLAPERLREINFPFFFYIAALFGVGEILHESGFNGRVVAAVLAALPEAGGHWLGEPLRLTATALPLDFLMDIAAVGAVATPTLLQAGAVAGLSPMTSAMSVALATTVAFLPYQAAPFMVALGYGSVRARDLSIAMLAISIASVLLLAPLSVLWWRWLGFV